MREEGASVWPDAKDYTVTRDGIVPVPRGRVAPHMCLEIVSCNLQDAAHVDVYPVCCSSALTA